MFIDFEKIVNPRELGGIPLSCGRHVKSGLLLRSAELSRASSGDLERLSGEFRIAKVFDFRDDSECLRSPDRPVEGAEYIHIPVLPELPAKDRKLRDMTPAFLEETFTQMYRDMARLDFCANAYRRFFRELLSCGGRAVLWHCTQGKDRTGIAAILLLSALGAGEETVRGEYFLTNEAMLPLFEAYRAAGHSPEETAAMEKLYFVMPCCLNAWYDCIKTDFGSVAAYLRVRLGLEDGDLRLLRDWYTE